MKYLNYLMVGTFALALTACGGSGDSGPGTATVTSSNVQDLAIASTNATNQSKTVEFLNIYGGSSTPSTPLKVSEFIAKGVEQTQQAPIDMSYMCSDGTVSINAGSGTTTSITFNNCTMSGTESNPVILNGTVNSSSSGNGNTITLQYVNFTIDFDGDVSVIDASISCTGFTTTSISCSYNVNFTGANGRHYAMGNLSVSGDAYTGLDVSATVTDPSHGTISFETTASVTFTCASPDEHIPYSGTIVFTGANGSTGSVSYNNDCASYDVTFNGVTTTYYW